MLKMKRIPVYPIVTKIPENEEQQTVYTVSFDGDIVIDIAYFKNFFRNFAEWLMLKPDTETMSDSAYFSSLWYNFIRANKHNYENMYKSLYTEYNPINEFEVEEQRNKTVQTGDKTFTHKPDGNSDIVSTKYRTGIPGENNLSEETYVSTYTSGTKPYSRTEQKGTSETDQEITPLSGYDDTTKKSDDTVTETISKSGNDKYKISEIISSEIEMRKKYVLADIIMGDFINQYLFYSGGVYNDCDVI